MPLLLALLSRLCEDDDIEYSGTPSLLSPLGILTVPLLKLLFYGLRLRFVIVRWWLVRCRLGLLGLCLGLGLGLSLTLDWSRTRLRGLLSLRLLRRSVGSRSGIRGQVVVVNGDARSCLPGHVSGM